jgi:hypothetical protein
MIIKITISMLRIKLQDGDLMLRSMIMHRNHGMDWPNIIIKRDGIFTCQISKAN